MKPERLDRVALVAMTVYALGVLSWYLPSFFPGRRLAMEMYMLLPPVWAGAAVHEILRKYRWSEFAPRKLAAVALGTGLAVRLAWGLFHSALATYNIRRAERGVLQAPDPSEGDLPPEFGLVVAYVYLCILLYLATAVALPMLVRALVRDMRKPLVTVTALLALVGCAPRSQPSARAPLTERQRDSVLAKSVLPGATVVGRALDVSDHAADRSAELAAADSLFR